MPQLPHARVHALVVRALVVASVSVLGACAGGDSATRPVAARVTVRAVTVGSGASDTLTVGDRRTFAVAVTGPNGAPLAGRRVVWTTTDGSVATVDSVGLVSALAPGRVSVVAESEGVSGETSVIVQKRPVARLAFERALDTVWVGRARTLRAEAQASDGSGLTGRTVVWTSADTSVVSVETGVDGTALVRGRQLGSARLLVASEGAGAVLPIVVARVPATRLTLTAPDTVLLGRSATLRAAAFAPDGGALASADIYARLVQWSSDRPSLLYVDGLADDIGQTSSGLTATATSTAAGTVTITASLDGAIARRTIVIARAPVAKLAFASATLSLSAGGTATVVGLATDADGFEVPGAPMVYTVTRGANVVRLVPTSTPDGTPATRIESIGAGSATVAVTVDGRTATLAVTVAAPSSGPTLQVFPSSITALPNVLGRLGVKLADAFGTTLPLGPVVYRSSDPSVVSIDATGRLSTVSKGAASLLVSASGTTVTVPVSVVAAPASAFHIDVRPVGNVPPTVLAAAQRAAERWERVVTSAVLPAQVDLHPGDCDVGTPALHQLVSTLVVFLKSEQIDGSRGTLAFAGPCVVHDVSNGGLPLVGAMTVDSADVSLLTGTTGALAEDVLTHELGHVLGIGTLWTGGTPSGALVSWATGDPRFLGRNAAAAAVRIGLAASVSDGAAVEDLGGAGTAGGHWRERTFTGELMTGWVNSAPNPLSIVTVQSLRDLGYGVTETGADVVTPTTIAGGLAFLSSVGVTDGPSLSRGGLTAPIPLGERLRTPKFVADRAGTRRIDTPASRQ